MQGSKPFPKHNALHARTRECVGIKGGARLKLQAAAGGMMRAADRVPRVVGRSCLQRHMHLAAWCQQRRRAGEEGSQQCLVARYVDILYGDYATLKLRRGAKVK